MPKEKFKAQFDLEWDDALKDGKLMNAMDAKEYFGVDVPALNTAWVEAQDAKKIVKLGGGFYCTSAGSKWRRVSPTTGPPEGPRPAYAS